MYNRRFLGLTVVLAGGLVAATPGLASAQPEEDPRTTAKMHVGPFYLTPTIMLKDLGVDTNVFNDASGNHQQDFTFTFTPAADVWLPLARRAMIITNAAVDLVYFQKFSSERSVDPYLRVRPELYFNRLTVFAGWSYLNTRQRPSYEIDARSEHTEQAAQAGFDIRVFRKLSFELAGGETQTRWAGDAFYYGTSLKESLDRDSRSGSLTIKHRWTPLTTFVLKGEAISDRFLYSPERDADSERVTAGFEFKPRAVISGEGYIGYRRFQTLSDAVPDFDGLVASATLSYRLLGDTRFGFTADRDVQYSFEPTQPYYVTDGYGLSVSRAIGVRYDVTVGVGRYQYSYRDIVAAGQPAPTVQRVDFTRNLSASLGYRPNRQTRIGVGASYWERTSNTMSYRDYNSLRAGVTVEYGLK